MLGKSARKISKSIVELAQSLRRNRTTLLCAVGEANTILEKICIDEKIRLLLCNNINPKRHPSRSGLHLNDAGLTTPVRNFKIV